MLEFLEQFRSSLSVVTQTFIASILVLFVYFNVRYTPKVVSLGPTILTTIGILATFLGIAIGLYGFDSTNIQASVPSLLAGLKTAFWASVVGVGAAVILKLREFLTGDGQEGDGSTLDDDRGTEIVETLVEVRNALAGVGDGSVVSQIKLARQDTNDRLDRLREAQTEALQKLSEMGSKALVEALRDVIRDFNQKITEQFGQNFKELNSAVGRLLEWQEHYKKTIDALAVHLETVIPLLGSAAEDIKRFVSDSGRFSQTADRLSASISALELGERRLHDVARGVVALLESTSSRIPQIEDRISLLTSQMTSAVQRNQADLNAALTDSAASIQRTLDSSEKCIISITTAASDALRENQKSIGNAVNENLIAMKTGVQTTQQEMTKASSEFDRHVKGLIQGTKDQVAELDRALATELTKSLESLARQFTSISDQFAKDYTPLANELRKIVEIAKKVVG